ncbi:MAG: hypothetical protein JRI23_16175 [Deltaproteobacteria bacterium]|nr:hypothetical protein [Deltaproteobacteria bacterium]MBW2533308.1 hypothetical protein [Deltaproteobacteria bacterium]
MPWGPALAKASRAAAGATERRFVRAWRAWLASLATDAEAATAAAHLYAELSHAPRDAWLDALAEDAPQVGVPVAALYGPLLAVEDDPQRRRRICAESGLEPFASDRVGRALRGRVADAVVVVLVQPLYLDFVRIIVCRFACGRGLEVVYQHPLVREVDAPRSGDVVEDVVVRPACADAVVDELAHAVVAHRRLGREMPAPLRACADLFSPRRSAARHGQC